MTVKPYIAINDFSGSSKGVAANNTNVRTILSPKIQRSSVTTPTQTVSRNKLPKILRSYKQISDSLLKNMPTNNYDTIVQPF